MTGCGRCCCCCCWPAGVVGAGHRPVVPLAVVPLAVVPLTIGPLAIGGRRYHCVACRTLTEASRALRLAVVPPLLTIHLNRSTADGRSKVRAHVQVPWTLCPGAWATADCPQRHDRYALVAIVFHSGHTATSGHYVCAARGDIGTRALAARLAAAGSSSSSSSGGTEPLWQPDAERWFLYDDSQVSATTARQLQRLMGPASVSPATAFLLVYQREEAPGP